MSKIEKNETIEEILSTTNIQDTFERSAKLLAKQSRDTKITKKQADGLSVVQSFIGQGVLGAPPICDPDKCGFASQCPVASAARGTRCPIELSLMKTSIQSWMESLPGLDPKNRLNMSFINQLVFMDVQEFRLRMVLSNPERSGLTQEVATLVDGDGNAYFEKRIAPEVNQLNKIYSERTKLLREMVSTPREAYKRAAALKESDRGEKAKQLSGAKRIIQKIEEGRKEND